MFAKLATTLTLLRYMISESVFQFSTANKLMQGNFNGQFTINELLQKGNFGIGTFNSLDGEMIVFNNNVYKTDSEGNIYTATGIEKTPFAINTFFNSTDFINLNSLSQPETFKLLELEFDSTEIIVAIKIEGIFNQISLRNPLKLENQTNDFSTIMKNVNHFILEQVTGTMIGFYFPESYEKLSTSGFHFHFIDHHYLKGGHVTDFNIRDAKVSFEIKKEVHIINPI